MWCRARSEGHPRHGRSNDVARDIRAITVDDGVPLYDVGGDGLPTRPNTLVPLDLAGAAGRVDQIAQTGIGVLVDG